MLSGDHPLWMSLQSRAKSHIALATFPVTERLQSTINPIRHHIRRSVALGLICRTFSNDHLRLEVDADCRVTGVADRQVSLLRLVKNRLSAANK